MQDVKNFFYLPLLVLVSTLFFSSLYGVELFDENPEFELMQGDYNEIIHYDPLIFIDNKLEEKSVEKLQKIIQDIKNFQNESKKITIFIEGHTEPSSLNEKDKIAKSREYALWVKSYLLQNNITNVEIILSARGDKNPYFTDIVDDIAKLSNRVMLSLYMVVPDDADGDGVYSDKDKCPGTKHGVFVGKDGCAVKNIIALVEGNKKNTAIAIATKKATVDVKRFNSVVAVKSATEAPTKPQVLTKAEIAKFFGDIAKESTQKPVEYLFYFDGTKVLDEPKNKLKEMIETLRKRETLPYVKIIGHTDKKGTDAYNKALGLKRARIIENIILNENIPLLDIDIESYGESNPAIKTDDESALQLNRRVEVFIY